MAKNNGELRRNQRRVEAVIRMVERVASLKAIAERATANTEGITLDDILQNIAVLKRDIENTKARINWRVFGEVDSYRYRKLLES